MGGTGATAYWICQEAIRNQRRQEAQMRRNLEVRRATRHLHVESPPRERHSIACASLCLDCGWLELPNATGDPMRSDPTSTPRGPCPQCHHLAWADLGDVEDARVLAESDDAARETRKGLRRLPLGMAVVLALGGAGAIALQADGPGLVVAALFFATLISSWQVARGIEASLAVGRATARRWRAPARRYRAGRTIEVGVIDGDATLVSPLGGREGIAWRIEVRVRGDRGNARALVEQCSSRLAIDGVTLAREPSLALRGTPVSTDAPHVREFLRIRGIELHDEPEVTEAVLVAGCTATLRRDRLDGPPVVYTRER